MRTFLFLLVTSASAYGCSSASFVVGGAPGDAGEDASIADGANGDASSDAAKDTATDGSGPEVAPPPDGAKSDAPADGPVLSCLDPSTFPTFDKGCTYDFNCSYGLHQLDCCGSRLAIGFNHSQATAFDAAEKSWEMTCPMCGCATKPTAAEDGSTNTTFYVKCDSGKCMTHSK